MLIDWARRTPYGWLHVSLVGQPNQMFRFVGDDMQIWSSPGIDVGYTWKMFEEHDVLWNFLNPQNFMSEEAQVEILSWLIENGVVFMAMMGMKPSEIKPVGIYMIGRAK
jgi:hypothetical protein